MRSSKVNKSIKFRTYTRNSKRNSKRNSRRKNNKKMIGIGLGLLGLGIIINNYYNKKSGPKQTSIPTPVPALTPIEIELNIVPSPSPIIIEKFKTLVEKSGQEASLLIKWVKSGAKIKIFIRSIGNRFDPNQVEIDLKNIGCDTNIKNSPNLRQYLFGILVHKDTWFDFINNNVPVLMLQHSGESCGFELTSETHKNVKIFIDEIKNDVSHKSQS